MSTHNVCFHGEIRKILCGHPLIWSSVQEQSCSLIKGNAYTFNGNPYFPCTLGEGTNVGANSLPLSVALIFERL